MHILKYTYSIADIGTKSANRGSTNLYWYLCLGMHFMPFLPQYQKYCRYIYSGQKKKVYGPEVAKYFSLLKEVQCIIYLAPL